ncbi:GerAB/ArcD/ProY family transporter [Clostridium ganghwense]|uniref:Endospore germination permease n=1 Tax=Clostridium ganghwense TaxID=312089 RepID=A0ABT4CMI1_9CLOT|nr:endospore germination permease [Clostridium ganghwense]MCY6370143.1 endospore germination permease [Clostridium ganghwense]
MINKIKNDILTPSQFIFTVLGTMLGLGILSLPNTLVKISQQDSWISTALGAVYPLYISLICIYVSKKYPNHNILFLSKKYFGNFLGSILNLLFLIQFTIYSFGVSSGYTNLTRVFTAEFLTPLKLIIVITTVCLYTASKGIQVIGKMCEIIFYITLPLIFLPLFALNKSSILNLLPIFGSGLSNILKGSIETVFSYTGIEVLFLIYPYINDKNKIKISSLKAVSLTAFIYIWIIFITIYYFSLDVTSKSLWPFLSASEIIDIPLINNFRYLFVLSWSFIILKTITIQYFIVVTILKDFMKKTNPKKIYFFIYPILICLPLFFTNEVMRRNFFGKVIPLTVIFSIIYVSSIALLVRIKG